MRKSLKIAGALVLLLILVGAISSAWTSQDDSASASKATSKSSNTASATTKASAPKKQAPKKQAPAETSGQKNARESAESYLENRLVLPYRPDPAALVGLRRGLFQGRGHLRGRPRRRELEQQAAKSAKSYLDTGSFSRQGLIQLGVAGRRWLYPCAGRVRREPGLLSLQKSAGAQRGSPCPPIWREGEGRESRPSRFLANDPAWLDEWPFRRRW